MWVKGDLVIQLIPLYLKLMEIIMIFLLLLIFQLLILRSVLWEILEMQRQLEEED